MTAPVAVPPPTTYASENDWFDLWLSPVFARPLQVNWCREWREHSEARFIIKGLWETWEIADRANNPNEMVVWARDYMYPLMDRLMADRGTFHGCDWRLKQHSMDTREPLG